METVTKTTFIITIFLIVFTVGIIQTADAMYADIPENPEVHFKAFVPQYAFIQRSFDFNVIVIDDRTEYCKCVPKTKPLYNANVTVTIYPSWTDKYIIEEITGKTLKNGYFAGSDFVTTHEYIPHDLYNMTISVSYGDSIDIQEFQFWTIERLY